MDRSEALVPMRQEVVRLEVTQLVNQATNRYKRQAVVPDAAGVLSSAGLLDESDRILKAELPRTVAPYMVVLASNAKKRGNKASARDHQKDRPRDCNGAPRMFGNWSPSRRMTPIAFRMRLQLSSRPCGWKGRPSLAAKSARIDLSSRIKDKSPIVADRAFEGCNSLTMSYFHTGIRTIIGAEAFHCPVRDGKEWDHLAMVIRHNLLPH